jgi:hypothetical protein
MFGGHRPYLASLKKHTTIEPRGQAKEKPSQCPPIDAVDARQRLRLGPGSHRRRQEK